LNSISDWRTTWSHIVSGRFSASPLGGLFCYDRENGIAAFYSIDEGGGIQLVNEFEERPLWTHVVAGVFGDSGYWGILFYDQGAGLARFCDTDGQGSLIVLSEDPTWLTSWAQVVAAPFVDSKYSGVLLYDQGAGIGVIYATDGHGGMTKLAEYDDWRTSWTHIVAGEFYWDDPGLDWVHDTYPIIADLFFYEGSTGYGETYSTDGHGHLSDGPIGEQGGFPPATVVLCGNFGANASASEWSNLLFYDGASQVGTVFALGDQLRPDGTVQKNHWFATETLGPTAPGVRPPALPRAYAERLPVKSPFAGSWDIIVAGNFWMLDPEDAHFGEHAKHPQYRFFYDSGFTDLFFYERAAGFGAIYLHESVQNTPIDPLAGYAAPRSVLPQQNIDLFVSSQVGAYRISIYRQDVVEIFMTNVPLLPTAGRPYAINRSAFEGAQWPPVANFSIPAQWPSGLYFARIQVGGPPFDNAGSEVAEPFNAGGSIPSHDPGAAMGPTANAGATFRSLVPPPVTLDIPFVVRAPNPGTRASLLVGVADTTYEAYNYWGGRGLYGHGSKGVDGVGNPTVNFVWTNPYNSCLLPRAFRVSFQRGFNSAVPLIGTQKWKVWEVPLLRWLARHGISADVCTVSDLELHGDILSNYRLFVSVGHDEYWSKGMRDNVEKFVSKGGNAAFFSGNTCWWQVRFEDGGDMMVCYKNAEFDPDTNAQLLTVQWDDPKLRRSSVSMTGVSGDNGWPNFPPDQPLPFQFFVVEDDKHWAFENTGLSNNDEFGVYLTPDGVFGSVVGGETDTNVRSNGSRLDNSPLHRIAAAYDPTYAAGAMGSFENGGTVFTVGTINWTLGLSQYAGGWSVIDQITWNVISRLS
jgi:hypothetical protein